MYIYIERERERDYIFAAKFSTPFIPQTDLSVGVLTVLLRGLGLSGAPLTAAGEHYTL